MPDGLRFVCLSDLHFGAENSLLTHLDDTSPTADPSRPSPALERLVDCLREVVAQVGGDERPSLVLNGDVLELALATDDVAAMAFDRFIDLAFDPAHPLFGPTVYYVPGNHDHHLWEMARERQYTDYVLSTPPEADLATPWHVTRLFERPDATAPGDQLPRAELLEALMRRRLGHDSTIVKIGYPNLGFATPDGSSTVIFHHGHFIETIYRLMTELRLAAFPASRRGTDVWDWEADNFAWIDFFWSTLGRSGESGQDVGVIYHMLQSPDALRWLAGNLGGTLSEMVPGPKAAGRAVSPAFKRVLGSMAARASRLERHVPGADLTDDAASGLVEYLSGPLRAQLDGEHPGASDGSVALVFGHTHKPFERTQSVTGFARPVALFNTGGWVVDTESTNPVQGAAVVLVDAEAHVASLRMYNQAPDDPSYAVSLAADPGPAADNPLHEALAGGLHLDAEPWTSFAAAVAEGVGRRHRALPQLIRHAMAAAPEPPPDRPQDSGRATTAP